MLARRRADAAELARRQRRASRRARLCLAPITGPGPIQETTVVSRRQAAADSRRATDQDLQRLAKVDLLNLAAGWEDPDEQQAPGHQGQDPSRGDGDRRLAPPSGRPRGRGDRGGGGAGPLP